jgi:hypothetical protein
MSFRPITISLSCQRKERVGDKLLSMGAEVPAGDFYRPASSPENQREISELAVDYEETPAKVPLVEKYRTPVAPR